MEPTGTCSAAEENEQMVARELEAAEALACLARWSGELESPVLKEQTATPSRRRSQDQALVVQPSFRKTCTMVESAFNTEETARLGTSYRSNSASKLRQTLSEAEKEARRIRRVLANRESARQTIRRRQAMHLALTRKAANLSEENENLKKEKKLAAEEYTLLKSRNEFLKLRMDNVKKAQMTEAKKIDQRTQAEIASSSITSPPMCLHNQPSFLPFVWPPILGSSNVFELEYAFGPDVMSSSQYPVQRSNIPFYQGQKISSGIPGPVNPLFVLPAPWLLPFLRHSTTLHAHSDANKKENEVSLVDKCSLCSPSDNHHLSLDGIRAPDSRKTVSAGSVHGAGLTFLPESSDHFSKHHPKATLFAPEMLRYIRPVERLRPSKDSQTDNFYNLNAVSASEHILQSSRKNNEEPIICSHKESEDVFTASKARMRRKELMKLKNIHCHRVCTCSINYQA